MFTFIKKLFKKKSVKKETTLSIERVSECDLCDHRDVCELKGYIVEITRPHHDTRHFIRGLGSNCMKKESKDERR